MNFKTLILYYLLLCTACTNPLAETGKQGIADRRILNEQVISNPYERVQEIPIPSGFTPLARSQHSFAAWLQQVKLKKDKTVYLFNGREKHYQSAQFAVLDISVGKQDLQQCADAVMRLRAEYLFAVRNFKAIKFVDNNGTVYQFEEPYTAKNLQRFLTKVFAMCGSASLAKQLTAVPFENIEPGDVIIRGGFPGHPVILMDVAVNAIGRKIYLLAQSYMPAQDIHVLLNPGKKESPWYDVNEMNAISTPEYNFKTSELKRW